MSNEEKIKLYNEIYSLSLEESRKLAANLFRKGKDEEGEYAAKENQSRYQRMRFSPAGRKSI